MAKTRTLTLTYDLLDTAVVHAERLASDGRIPGHRDFVGLDGHAADLGYVDHAVGSVLVRFVWTFVIALSEIPQASRTEEGHLSVVTSRWAASPSTTLSRSASPGTLRSCAAGFRAR